MFLKLFKSIRIWHVFHTLIEHIHFYVILFIYRALVSVDRVYQGRKTRHIRKVSWAVYILSGIGISFPVKTGTYRSDYVKVASISTMHCRQNPN